MWSGIDTVIFLTADDFRPCSMYGSTNLVAAMIPLCVIRVTAAKIIPVECACQQIFYLRGHLRKPNSSNGKSSPGGHAADAPQIHWRRIDVHPSIREIHVLTQYAAIARYIGYFRIFRCNDADTNAVAYVLPLAFPLATDQARKMGQKRQNRARKIFFRSAEFGANFSGI